MKEFLSKLKRKQNLTFEESKNAFEILMNGKASNREIFDFLTLLSLKGEIILKNYLISTGTCTKAIPLDKNDNVKVDFGKLGKIEFKFE